MTGNGPAFSRWGDIAARHQIHHQKEAAAGETAQPAHAHDVRMPQPREQAGLLHQPFHCPAIVLPRLVQGLEGDQLAARLVPRPVDLAHATGAQQLLERIVFEP